MKVLIIKFRSNCLCVPRGLVVKPLAGYVEGPGFGFAYNFFLFASFFLFLFLLVFILDFYKFPSRLYLPFPRSLSRGPAIYVFLILAFIYFYLFIYYFPPSAIRRPPSASFYKLSWSRRELLLSHAAVLPYTDNASVKSKRQHSPRATPLAFDFFENYCSNSPPPGPKCRSNALHLGPFR